MEVYMAKRILITGATAGIGRATLDKFYQEGFHILACDINAEEGSKLSSIYGARVDFIELDVTNENNWKSLQRYIHDKDYQIDVLFNNAGIFVMNDIVTTTEKEYQAMFDINVKGSFLALKYIAPIMYKQETGSIIHASSNAAFFGAKGLGIYGATKGAIRTLTKNAAMEFAPFVRVNSIHPGYIQTQMIEYAAQKANKTPQDQAKYVPLKRLGRPEEIASLVYYLGSGEASYMTGSEIVIDGGVSSGQSIWEEEQS